jgi:hypothetical protein
LKSHCTDTVQNVSQKLVNRNKKGFLFLAAVSRMGVKEAATAGTSPWPSTAGTMRHAFHPFALSSLKENFRAFLRFRQYFAPCKIGF